MTVFVHREATKFLEDYYFIFFAMMCFTEQLEKQCVDNFVLRDQIKNMMLMLHRL